MDETTLNRRRPVWEALAELFLDTETRWFLARIALVLVESGYNCAELERIWEREVIPEFGSNLLQPIGEWTGLRVDEASLARRAERFSFRGWAVRMLVKSRVAAQWQAIRTLRQRLLELPEFNRAGHVQAWVAFAHAYVGGGDAGVLLHSSGLSRAELERSFEWAFREAYRGLVSPNEEEQCTARVRTLVDAQTCT